MKNRFLSICAAVLAAFTVTHAHAEVPLLINCQGRLYDGQALLNGEVDMVLRIYDAAIDGKLQYEDRSAVTCVDGIYSTYLGDHTVSGDLMVALSGREAWLEVATGDHTFTPRERLVTVPYALLAGGVKKGGVTSEMIGQSAVLKHHLADRTVTLDKLAEGSVSSESILDGSIQGDDLALGSVTADKLRNPPWGLNGNVTRGGAFLGTVNDRPLELRANNRPVLRLYGSVLVPTWVGGAIENRADGAGNVIAGGGTSDQPQEVLGSFSFVGGGAGNRLLGSQSVLLGGSDNVVSTNRAVVVGGRGNLVEGLAGSILGGVSNRVEQGYATIGGGFGNVAEGYVSGIAGGWSNVASGAVSHIGGGQDNAAVGDASVVAGGWGNHAAGKGAMIGGGKNQSVDGAYGFVGGGTNNMVRGELGSILGGSGNRVEGFTTTIGGGQDNRTEGAASTVAGGFGNRSAGSFSSVGGGAVNEVSGNLSVVAGGYSNRVEGAFATIPGGGNNRAEGDYSLAAGKAAEAVHQGAFVWSDTSGAAVRSSAPNQFVARAAGGVEFLSSADGVSGVRLAPGAGAWSMLSDRAAKEELKPVDSQLLLDRLALMPVYTWQYRNEPGAVRHIGPTAQDFHAAFGAGDSERHIATVDADGVSFAAVQALYELMRQRDRDLEALRAMNEALLKRVEQLEQR